MSGWAVLCGALASGSLRWQGEDLLLLAMVILLVELGWGRLWDMAAGTDWQGRTFSTPSTAPAPTFPAPPYSQPGSLAWRLFKGLHHFGFWWRRVLWPTFGATLLGFLSAVALTVVLLLLLPDRLRLLSTALVALAGLGVLWRWRSQEPLAVQGGAQIGLSWLAGQAALAEVSPGSLALALFFASAAWGVLRSARGLRWGFWLLYGGQAGSLALLITTKQPLVAGLIGLLIFGQATQQISRPPGTEVTRPGLERRLCPWLAAAMIIAATALP
jgi:hypothetical protein